MQRLEHVEHALRVVLGKVEARRLLEALGPELVPEDGDADELVADERRLLDEERVLVAHAVHDAVGDLLAHQHLRLGRDEERVDERLRVGAADEVEQLGDGAPDERVRDVDARDDLRDDLEPDVDADAADALRDRNVDEVVVAVLEPQREQPERVLQRVALGQRD